MRADNCEIHKLRAARRIETQPAATVAPTDAAGNGKDLRGEDAVFDVFERTSITKYLSGAAHESDTSISCQTRSTEMTRDLELASERVNVKEIPSEPIFAPISALIAMFSVRYRWKDVLLALRSFQALVWKTLTWQLFANTSKICEM